METKFNVFEVLEIAEQIEHKAAKYFLKSAQLCDDAEVRDLYYRLATWKAKHEKLWSRMRQRFSEKTGEFGTFDPDNYVLSNPEVMAGLTGFATKQAAPVHLTAQQGKKQILKDAIRRSNEVLIFYQGLKDFARDPATTDTIDRIVKEETRQMRFLSNELKEASDAGPA